MNGDSLKYPNISTSIETTHKRSASEKLHYGLFKLEYDGTFKAITIAAMISIP